MDLELLQHGIDQSHPKRGLQKTVELAEQMKKDEWEAAQEFAGKYSQEQRRQMAKDGRALPDGSFPIDNAQDVKDAVGLVGNYKGPHDAKSHVKKRAKAVGATQHIPDTWS